MSQTNEYPSLDTAPAGSIRFNTDSNKMEIYNGEQWWNIDSTSPTEQTGGTRGLFAGGYRGSPNTAVDTIDLINVDTTGDASDFGNLTSAALLGAGFASRTRGVISLGVVSPNPAVDTIDLVTISSTGNASDFGNLSIGRRSNGGCSSSTRGLFAGGVNPGTQSRIDYVTIAATGNAVEFGDLSLGRTELAGCASPTRGIFAGRNPSNNIIDYVTISTLGDAADFGDLTRRTSLYNSAPSNAVRGLFGGNFDSSTIVNTIDYITIATLGNALDFGDLTRVFNELASVASPTRGVWGGGYAPSKSDIIDYVQIMSTGNAVDFGNLQVARGRFAGSCSNGHGGLG